MLSSTALLEEIKETGKSKDSKATEMPSPNASFQIANTPYLPVIQSCLQNPPHLIYQISHDSIAIGGSSFQSYLLGELLPKTKLKYTMKRVTIVPVNSEIIMSIKNFFEANSKVLQEELYLIYKDRLNDFKLLRFALIENVFKSSAQKTTSLSVEEQQKTAAEAPTSSTFKEPLIITALKELLYVAAEHCISFTKELNKELETLDNIKEGDKQMEKDVLFRFVTLWNKYFLSALEINNHIGILNEFINNVTEKLIVKIEKKIPKFSLWRALVGVFRTFSYLPLHSSLHKNYLKYVKCIVLNNLKNKAESPKPVKSLTNFNIEAFMKGDQEDDEETQRTALEENLHAARVIFQSLLDMNLNEITVHYVNSKELVLKLCQDFTNPLAAEINEIAEEAIALYGKTSKFIEVIISELSLLNKIFPPCMWDDIEIAARKVTLSVVKEKLAIIAGEFSKMGKQLQKEKSAGCQSHSDDKFVAPIVQTLKNELGKPYLTGEELKMFVPYIHKEHITEYKECVEQRTAYITAQNKEKRVEDIEIELKNKCLDLIIDEDANVLFKMGGMNVSEVRKMPT